MHWEMAWARVAVALTGTVAVGLALVSGSAATDPRTPPALAGQPAPFLGTAVVGSGGLTAAVDAYGDVVDLRAPGPAGRGLIDNPSARQEAGSVASDTGIVPRVRFGGGPWLAPWRAASVAQRFLPGTNVVRTTARFGPARTVLIVAIAGGALAVSGRVEGGGRAASLRLGVEPDLKSRCEEERYPGAGTLICGAGRRSGYSKAKQAAGRPASRARERIGAVEIAPRRGGRLAAEAGRIARRAAAANRRWLSRARPLGRGAPAWARRLYRRSLLTLRALTDRRTGAVAAGARDGWAYVWPRDAATVAMALAASGYRAEACEIAGFLGRLDLDAAARFAGDGAPVPGRGPEGDAAGWAAGAIGAARNGAGDVGATEAVRPATRSSIAADCACCRTGSRADRAIPRRPSRAGAPISWRNRADYREGPAGDYLGNAIAAFAPLAAFETPRGLVRAAGDPGSGLDSAAAWAVRPFPRPALFPLVRRTLLRLASHQGRFGVTPGEGWPEGDPWTAPTAWSAWSLAALGERRAALRLLADLRRAATPAGELPERVGAGAGIPRSTTPLAWSHGFAILALRQLWPGAMAEP